MDKYLEPLVLRAGTSAAVEVPFSGSPQPKVAWMVGGQILRDVRRVRVETIHNLTTLVISRAERSDAGTYTLSLENQLGTSKLTVQVTVLGKSLAIVSLAAHQLCWKQVLFWRRLSVCLCVCPHKDSKTTDQKLM